MWPLMNSVLLKGTPLSTADCTSLPRLFRLLKFLALTALAVMPLYINLGFIHRLFLFSAALEVVGDAEDIIGT